MKVNEQFSTIRSKMTNLVFASDSGYVRQLLVASGSAVYALRRSPVGGGYPNSCP